MALQEIEFTSHNGRDTIQAWVYEPVGTPRAVVHLIHGLGEHSRRYLHLTSTLVDAGFVVVADDHAGHGRTAMQSGVWADGGEDGGVVAVTDEATLFHQARELFPDLPYVVLGHSWGSMIARVLAVEPGVEVDGLALCGIAAQMKGIEQSLDRERLRAAKDSDGASPVADDIVGAVFDGFLDRCGPDAGPTDWIATDADVVADHGRDRFNNFGAPMSNRFLQGFVDTYDLANHDAFYARMPKVPVAIFAGGDDPVANFGEGAKAVAGRLEADGHDVELHLYEGMRHEVHNEPASRADVEEALVAFVERVAGQRA